jgi:predicted DNA-binding ribbon-helix-helix protein
VFGEPRKRSLTIAGHQTSISLEDIFWQALREVAAEQDRSPSDLVADIDKLRRHSGLSGAVRVYLLDHYRRRGRKKVNSA